jgi:hypothetical protein
VLFRWLRNRRRRALLREPFPQPWKDLLEENVRSYRRLTAAEQGRVRDYVQIFAAEKHWEGCGGQQITDEVRVTVAGLVAILVLGLEAEYFDHVLSILVYPDAYVARASTGAGPGVIIEGDSARQGEAWYRGPVILSWSDVLAGGLERVHGRNLVFHEFAHQLDMLNGRRADGVPPLETAAQAERWTKVVGEHYRELVHDCSRGHAALLDCYGATSPAEFFAVATETFFQRPSAMQHRHPELYACLREFYRQDPVARETDSRHAGLVP